MIYRSLVNKYTAQSLSIYHWFSICLYRQLSSFFSSECCICRKIRVEFKTWNNHYKPPRSIVLTHYSYAAESRPASKNENFSYVLCLMEKRKTTQDMPSHQTQGQAYKDRRKKPHYFMIIAGPSTYQGSRNELPKRQRAKISHLISDTKSSSELCSRLLLTELHPPKIHLLWP